MTAFAFDTPTTHLQSRFIPELVDDKKIPDRETLEDLAALMGVDLQHVEDQIAEQERLHHLAWKKSRKSKGQSASSVTQFIEVVEFQGKQLFWSIGGQEFVVGAGGKRFCETSIKDALHRLACE